MNRSALVKGPAKIVRGALSLFTQADFNVDITAEFEKTVTDVHGEIDQTWKDVQAECGFTPEGRWDAATIAGLWPYANPSIGSSIFTDNDVPTVIHCSNANKHTLIASAITKMPELVFDATKTLIGQATIRGIRGNNKAWSDADGIYKFAAAGGSLADAAFSPSLIKKQVYKLDFGALGGDPEAWAPAGFQNVYSEDGILFSPEIELGEVRVDQIGLADVTIQAVRAMVKLKPVGPTAAQIIAALAIQGASAARGASTSATGQPLTITGADGIVYLTIPNATLVGAGFRFGRNVLRNGEIGFVANRTFTGGASDALFELAAE
jgi:hypothetical protein